MTNRSFLAWSERFVRLVAFVALAAGALALAGGFLSLPWTGWARPPRAAVLGLGGAWLLLRGPAARRQIHPAVSFTAACGVLVAGLIGVVLVNASEEAARTGLWIVLSARGALACPLLGLSMMALSRTAPRSRGAGHVLAAAAAVLVFFEAVLSLYTVAGGGPRSSLPYAAAHLLLAVAVLATVPEHGLFALFTGPAASAHAARRLVPAFVVVAIAVGWIAVGSAEAGWLDGPTSAALAVTLAGVAFVAILRRLEAGLIEGEAREQAAQAALRRSEERYRSMVDALSDAVVVTDRRGRIVSWNRGAETMFGWAAQEILGRPIETLVPEGFPAGPDDALEGAPPCASSPLDALARLRGRRKDGREFPLELSCASWREGAEPFDAAVIRDLGERRRSEEALARLGRAVQQSAESVMITDADANITYVNPAFERITGYAREEVVGHNPRLLKSGRHDRAFYESMWAVLTRGETWSGRLFNRRKDGSLLEEEVSISPVRDPDGRVVSYVAVKRDVTEVSSLQRQLVQAQRIEGIGRLAGGVAHDFNNLLAVILGYTDLLRRQSDPGDRARAKLDQIHEAAERGAGLTRQLLAFSRRQVLELRVLDLNRVVPGFAKMLERLLGEDIELRLALEPALGAVKADEGQIEQILMNLAVNARDAMPDGGTLSIETANAELDDVVVRGQARMPAGRYVVLSVSDDGTGMDEETQAHAFEPFFTTKPAGKGTGLGLATVYGIVKQTGGYIWLYSEPGHGTTFKIYLPRVQEIGAAPAPPGAPVVHRGDATVLVVEDDPALRELTLELLQDAGYRTLVADGPASALAEAEAHAEAIDLLLSDVVMPGGTGPELARRLRARRPGLAVLFMSGYTDEAVARNGVLEPGVSLLTKPFTVESLTRKVREVLDGPR